MGMNPRGRSRGRNHNFNNNRRFNNNGLSRNTVFDSQGPAGRLRGTAYQLMEKYLAAAKDAMSTDRVLAENCLQHADHYMRLNAMAVAAENQNRFPLNQPQPVTEEIADADENAVAAVSEPSAEEASAAPDPVPVIFPAAEEEKTIDLNNIAGADLSVPVAAIAENHAQTAVRPRRGRPPMRRPEPAAEENAATPAPRRRGRPPKQVEE